MDTQKDKQDQWLDRNLSSIGRELPLPTEPTELQQARWKQPPSAGAAARIAKGIKLMRRNKLFTFFGAGSVVAACLALSVMFWGVGANNRVEAATIFQSLRDSVKQAFTITFDNIVDDGYRVDGEVLVILHEGEGPEVAENSIIAGDINEKGAYLEMHFRSLGDENAPPELDLDLAVAATEENEWLFFHARSLPEQLRQEQPLLGMLAALAKDGLLLELDGMLRQGFLSTRMELTGPDDAGAGKPPPHARGVIKFGVGVGSDKGEEDAENAAEETATFKFDLSAGDDAETPDPETRIALRRTQQEEAMQAAASSIGMEYDQLVRVTEAINNMFTGRMTREQLESVISWIESAAGEVSVEEQAGGLFVLTARDFDFGDLSLDEETAAELSENVIEIGYRKETGVEWAAVLNVGKEQGRMVFEFVDRDTSDPVFGRERWIGEKVRVFDLAALGNMFSGSMDSK